MSNRNDIPVTQEITIITEDHALNNSKSKKTNVILKPIYTKSNRTNHIAFIRTSTTDQSTNNQLNHINNQQRFNQTGNTNNQAVNMNNQLNMNNQANINNQANMNNQVANNQVTNMNNNSANNESENNQGKKGINLVLCILAALSINEAVKYFINKSIRMNNGTSSRYIYYAVVCVAAVILYNLIL